jgi:glutamate-1-semialdehyde 2,1-aminomutase
MIFRRDLARTAKRAFYITYSPLNFVIMLGLGIYLPPSQFEAAFISTAHTERIIEKTIKASYKALQR